MPVRCLQLLRTAKAALGEILSAFEFLDRQALQLTLEHLPEAADPLPGQQAPIYILLETSGSNEEHDHAKLQVSWRGAVPVCWCRWQRAELLPMAPHAGFQILGLGLTAIPLGICPALHLSRHWSAAGRQTAAPLQRCSMSFSCTSCCIERVRNMEPDRGWLLPWACMCSHVRAFTEQAEEAGSRVSGLGVSGSLNMGPNLRWLHVQAFTKQAEEAGLAAGFQVAQGRQQMQQLWGLRTGISVALRNAGTHCAGILLLLFF